MATPSRRDFFKKLSLGLASTAAISNLPISNNTHMKAVKQVKPMGFNWETIDPFLFCVHHEDAFPKGNDDMSPAASLSGRSIGDDFIIKDGWRMYHGSKVPGFPGHPHRGFETITIVRKGFVDHADSLGAAGRYGEGDVQWMTAGKGVQHSEMFPLLSNDKENPMELFQIWLNLPAKNKMAEPHFKMLWGSKIPKYSTKDDEGRRTLIEVIAGKLYDHVAPPPPPESWASDPHNEVAIFNIHADANGSFTLPKAGKAINRVLYFYSGDTISINENQIKNYHLAEVEPDVDLSINIGSKDAKILLLQGKPINETVMQYGPFVMNSKEEIQQAFSDFHKTQFGGWPWSRYDQVHDRKLGRFARHADGTFEEGV
jgi:redox-sensitive bicupin YhaK (pirin superfamily)